MKRFVFAMLILLGVAHAGQVCSSPKYQLVNSFTYTCDNAAQKPLWAVLYYQNRIAVFIVQPNNGEVAYVPVAFRSKSSDFMNAGETLHVWLTKDSLGLTWIQMTGTK